MNITGNEMNLKVFSNTEKKVLTFISLVNLEYIYVIKNDFESLIL